MDQQKYQQTWTKKEKLSQMFDLVVAHIPSFEWIVLLSRTPFSSFVSPNPNLQFHSTHKDDAISRSRFAPALSVASSVPVSLTP